MDNYLFKSYKHFEIQPNQKLKTKHYIKDFIC